MTFWVIMKLKTFVLKLEHLLAYFCPYHNPVTNTVSILSIKTEKSVVDVVLGIWTWGCRMVSVDRSTEHFYFLVLTWNSTPVCFKSISKFVSVQVMKYWIPLSVSNSYFLLFHVLFHSLEIVLYLFYFYTDTFSQSIDTLDTYLSYLVLRYLVSTKILSRY